MVLKVMGSPAFALTVPDLVAHAGLIRGCVIGGY